MKTTDSLGIGFIMSSLKLTVLTGSGFGFGQFILLDSPEAKGVLATAVILGILSFGAVRLGFALGFKTQCLSTLWKSNLEKH